MPKIKTEKSSSGKHSSSLLSGTLKSSSQFKTPQTVRPKLSIGYDPRKHGALCDKCPRRGSLVVPPNGPKGAKICWLGQDPGQQEVKQGRGFVGPHGARLQRLWEEATTAWGKKIERIEVWITNAALCAPPPNGGDAESRQAMTCCRPRLARELKQLHPQAGILAMGKWAWFALTGQETGVGAYLGYHVKVDPDLILSEANDVGDKFKQRAIPSAEEEES